MSEYFTRHNVVSCLARYYITKVYFTASAGSYKLACVDTFGFEPFMTSPSLQVRVGVGAFILKSSRESPENPHFLIGKRRNAHGAGTYGLPGGHLEFGETPEQCAAREVMEETGLKVSDVQFLTATNDYMPAEGKHYITLFVVCSRDNNDDEPQVLEPDKCEEWEWASWEDLMTWVKLQSEAREDTVLEKKLFLPLLNLVLQRPEVRIPMI